MRRACSGLRRDILPSSTVCKMSSRSSGRIVNARQEGPTDLAIRGEMYKVRMDTAPEISIECTIRAGTHTPLCDGITHVPVGVCTVITPFEAYTSWCSA